MATLPQIPVAVYADSDDPMRTLTSRFSDSAPDIRVDAVVETWAEFATIENPEDYIVLVDAELEDELSIVDRIRAIRAAGARAIVLSGVDAPKSVIQYMAAGADAALNKSDGSRRIADQIRLAANRSMLIRQRGD